MDRDEDYAPPRGFRVKMRGGLLPKSKLGRIAASCGLVAGLAGMTIGVVAARRALLQDERFTIDSSSAIEIEGNSHVSRAQLLGVFGEDVERNIFYVPLTERRAELERLPWVQHATVMRLMPNRLRVAIVERTPVAFVRETGGVGLVDANGVLLPSGDAGAHYSFPVVSGIAATDPISTRGARMRLYGKFIENMDSSGEKISEKLSEVDLSNPEDIKALIPEGTREILVHFGGQEQEYLDRYRKFEQHLPEWQTQYPNLASVDMRYDRQVVLEMQPGSAVPDVDAPVADDGAAEPQEQAKPVAAPAKAALTKKAAVRGKVKAKR